MKSINRGAVIAVGAATAVAVSAPAFAANAAPTSLNLRAGKAVVKAHDKDTFSATLTSKGKAVAAQTVWLQERTAPTTGHKTTWSDVTSMVTDTNGKASFTVTPPAPSTKNTQKDQYRAVYKKSATYGGSHSQIVTVTVKKA